LTINLRELCYEALDVDNIAIIFHEFDEGIFPSLFVKSSKGKFELSTSNFMTSCEGSLP
jgi:hypothetical protein